MGPDCGWPPTPSRAPDRLSVGGSGATERPPIGPVGPLLQIEVAPRAVYGPPRDVVQLEHPMGSHAWVRVNWRGPAESAAGIHSLRCQPDPDARGAGASSRPRLRRLPVGAFPAVRPTVPVTGQAGSLWSSLVGKRGACTPAFSVLRAMSRHGPPHSPYAGSCTLCSVARTRTVSGLTRGTSVDREQCGPDHPGALQPREVAAAGKDLGHGTRDEGG